MKPKIRLRYDWDMLRWMRLWLRDGPPVPFGVYAEWKYL